MIRAALAALAALALALPGAAAAQEASLTDIEDEVMCPICGTTLELSDSPQAERERELIRSLIDAGQSKEQIKDRLVAEYGQEVLATPESSGFDATAWLVPALGLAAVGLGIVLFLRRRPGSSSPGPEIDQEDADRLEADLSSWDAEPIHRDRR